MPLPASIASGPSTSGEAIRRAFAHRSRRRGSDARVSRSSRRGFLSAASTGSRRLDDAQIREAARQRRHANVVAGADVHLAQCGKTRHVCRMCANRPAAGRLRMPRRAPARTQSSTAGRPPQSSRPREDRTGCPQACCRLRQPPRARRQLHATADPLLRHAPAESTPAFTAPFTNSASSSWRRRTGRAILRHTAPRRRHRPRSPACRPAAAPRARCQTGDPAAAAGRRHPDSACRRTASAAGTRRDRRGTPRAGTREHRRGNRTAGTGANYEYIEHC